MTSLLSNLISNIVEGIHKIKYKYWRDNKTCETSRIEYKYCNCFLEYTNFKDNLIEHKCFYCNKNYQQKFDKKLKEGLLNTYKFSNHNNNNFILLLQRGVYPYEYMEHWEKIQWNIIIWKRRFWQPLKFGRYYRCRLRTQKEFVKILKYKM